MTAKYFAILTNYGAAQLANAVALGTQMNISTMAVGDGGGTLPVPDPAQTKLVRETRRAAVNQVSIDEKNPNFIIAEQVIPENEGGWFIREIGLFDDNGGLIAVGNAPETYKPNLQEGSGRTQVIQMVLMVSSTQAITLKVDPSVVLATREYVTKSVDAAIQASEAKAAKIYATKTELSSGLSGKQPTGDYATRTELNNGLSGKQPTGDYATKTEVNSKLAKDQNGADIPNKDTFIKNLGLGEIYATWEDVGQKLDKSKVTNSLINSRELVPTTALMIDNLALKQPVGDYQPKGEYALLSDLKSLIKPGFTMQTILDEADIAPPWYLINGDRYGLDTPQGKVLRAFSADLKARWNITQTAETITLPKTLQSDGRMPFPRPVNGTGRKTGSVSGDTIRNFTGELGYEANYGLTTGERDVSGVFRAYGASKGSFTGGGGGRSLNIMFDPSTVVPTGPENKPLDVGVTWIMYLGV
ncbi:TPA: phage tail protein [Morganella morganii]|uniref:phage tail protein n=2 Tax=Morganella morganii TaxID=582 RepID=UPI001FFC674C|nr:phage tail protein [Morganella morganii]MCW3200420.1 phage tail protein [Morganella morganii]